MTCAAAGSPASLYITTLPDKVTGSTAVAAPGGPLNVTCIAVS